MTRSRMAARRPTFALLGALVVLSGVVPGARPAPAAAIPPPVVPIHDVQTSAHLSPLDGQPVSLLPAIVTAKVGNGFYLQTPDTDADADVATSEAIFIFTLSAPTVNVGDNVSVTGTVSEFRPGGAAASNASLTITEIVSPAIVVNSTGNALPTATVVGVGGRMPPTAVIEDDATPSVETSGVFDPANDGIDFYESLEHMRLFVNDAVASGPTNTFGEISVLPDNGSWAGTRTARGGIVIQQSDFNPERIILDNVISATPDVHVGDGLGDVTGVLDYSSGNFKLYPTSVPIRTDNGLAREVTALTRDTDEITMATFKADNLDPADSAAKFTALADQIVDNLLSPDVVVLEGIQDDNGPTNDATVDATTTANMLIAAISATGGPTYDYRDIDPVDDQDGGEPGGNIRVAFLFRTDRGVAFVDRAGGGSTTDTTVVDNGGTPELSSSPGRIKPTDGAFTSSRKPLAAEFTFRGQTLFVIANHWNSRGGDQPLFGRYQPPILASGVQRLQQAVIVNDFVESILAIDTGALVAVMGDLNDYHWSAPLVEVAGDDLDILILTLPVAERYGYVFDGNSLALDHILVSGALDAVRTGFDEVHVNSEFYEQVSDHDPSIARFSLGDTAAPSVTVPVADFRTSIALNTSSTPIPLRVSWTASDPSGISSTKLQQRVNGGAFANVTLASLAAVTANVNVGASGSTTRQFRARATDTVANTSGYQTGDLFRARAFQNGSPSVVQTGTWRSQSSSSFFGGSVHYASAAGRKQSLTTTATDFAVVSTRGPDRGMADVYVDGVFQTTIDLYRSATESRRVIFAISFPTAGSHKIVLRVKGTKNAASSGKRVDFDAFLTMGP